MITCNRCGNLSPNGAVSCQTCGAPLSSKNETGSNSQMGGPQGQPGLPAWLESLRAGERSAPSMNNTNFTGADLIDEGTLPAWMRPQRGENTDISLSGSFSPVAPSNPFLSSNTDSGAFPPMGAAFPPQGINANSLIDEQALPSWMQENKQRTETPPQSGIAASSLVQSDSVPDWMKQLQQGPAANPVQASQPMKPVEQRPAQNFSAKDLIDQSSLPSWMTPQGGNQQSPLASPSKAPSEPPVQSGEGNRFSASSLLDADAMPSWLRENGQQQRSGAMPPIGSPAPTMPSPQQNSSWQTPGQPVGAQPSGQMPSFDQQPGGFNGGISGSSFVDESAVPNWLRAVGEQNQASGQQPPFFGPAGTPSRPSNYDLSPRVDNVRVPSRPRSEVNSNESSEVAANVFASMLGVASTAPQYPQMPPNQPLMNQGMQQPPSMPMQNTQMPNQMQGQMPPMGMQGMPPTPSQQSYPQSYGNNYPGQGGLPGSYGAGGPFSSSPQYPGMVPSQGGPSNMGMGGEQKPPVKKRGFFDALRDLFFRQS